VPDNPRIEELRRRVLRDPASIAFAQLAEEHRRAGQYEEAIEVARAGLNQHPAYLSARVTLGRALIEVARLDEAAAEFEYVVKAAPDNLTAVRQLADIQQRRHQVSNDTKSGQAAIKTAPAIPLPVSPAPPPPIVPAPAAAPQHPERRAVIDAAPSSVPVMDPVKQPPIDPVLTELEAWLAVLVDERSRRPSANAGRH